MRVLFFGRQYTYFRNFEAVLQQLAVRGHALHLAVERGEAFGGLKMVQALADAYPNVTYGDAPGRPLDDDWAWTAVRLRLGLDYLRYQHPIFDEAPTLRERARDRTPGAFVVLADKVPGLRRARRLCTSVVTRIERAIPEDPSIRAYIAARRPDVVLITPLVDLGSSQIDYLRAARALGIPTAVCVWSWDHLSSKALIRESPDRVFVWNETQKQEAEQLHGIPSARIVVTGAQCFDQWFDRQPTRDRAAFCAQVGLPASAPILLYVCSALFSGSPVEAAFVVRWIRELRARGSPALRACGILIRPHPSRLPEWQQVDLSGLGPVSVWGGNPVDVPSRADYFDSLYHSAAVVGLNTSAFIEAAIVGRPVHTIVLPEFASNQTGTVHFTYLLKAGGGLLRVAHDFAEHATQIDDSLSRPAQAIVPFVRAFVRPYGLDVAATPLFVQRVEEMGGLRVEPSEDPRPVDELRVVPSNVEGRLRSGQVEAPTGMWHRAADAIRRMRSDQRYEQWVYSSREVESLRSSRERARLQKEAEAVNRAREHAERQRKAEARARRAALRAQRKAGEAAHMAARRAERDRRRLEKQAQAEERRARQHAEDLARLNAKQQEKAGRRDARAAEKQASLVEKRARADAERRARRAETEASR